MIAMVTPTAHQSGDRFPITLSLELVQAAVRARVCCLECEGCPAMSAIVRCCYN